MAETSSEREITHYTERKLRYYSDRLPAVSGLARAMTNHSGDQYLAGLWRNDLVRGLLWCVSQPLKLPHRPRAPSWSWSSVDSAVYWALGFRHYQHRELRGHWEEVATVLEARTEIKGEDPTGSVTSGRISLRCRAKTVKITKLLFFQIGSLPPKYCYKFQGVESELMLCIDSGIEAEEGWVDGWTCLAVPLGASVTAPTRFFEGQPVYKLYGLLLKPCYTKDRLPEYSRVGLFQTYPASSKPTFFNNWQSYTISIR